MQELDAGQISPRAEIVLHMELEGDYAEKTAGFAGMQSFRKSL